MKISELQPKQGKVEIKAKIVEKSDIRTFEKFGNAGKVCNATIKDDSGEMKLTLWNDEIDKVNVGDTVHIKNGYVSEFQGEKQLSAGKYGSMEVIKGDGAADAPSQPAAEPAPEISKETVGEELIKDEDSRLEEEEN